MLQWDLYFRTIPLMLGYQPHDKEDMNDPWERDSNFSVAGDTTFNVNAREVLSALYPYTVVDRVCLASSFSDDNDGPAKKWGYDSAMVCMGMIKVTLSLDRKRIVAAVVNLINDWAVMLWSLALPVAADFAILAS